MDPDALIALGREALFLALVASGPPLLASLAAGLLMGILQAVTQIQEGALSAVAKLSAAVLALVLAGPWVAEQLMRFTVRLLAAMSTVQL